VKFLAFIGVVLISTVQLVGQNLNQNSTGSFTFTPTGPLSNQPVEVYYHIPNGDISTMPIVMSFHGSSRNGSDYRDYWITMANANGFMVFAPEFSSSNYPGLGDSYLMANIFDDGDNPSLSTYNNPDEWTFSVLDPIFENIKSDISGTQEAYIAWGHSGGAQFLHRFIMYMPSSKLDVAVCSNAGWYTVPENTVSFPYGILNGQLPNSTLITAFSKKLIVHLGQNDTDPNSPGLRRNSVVDNQQGIHRLERGQYFFSTSQSTAQGLNTAFNWEKHEAAGIGHDAQQMANAALPYILMRTLSSTEYELKTDFNLYPNPTSNHVFFDNSSVKLKKVELYTSHGQFVKTFEFSTFEKSQKINLSDLNSGLYILKTNENYIKLLKK
jgi:hypothetical protein